MGTLALPIISRRASSSQYHSVLYLFPLYVLFYSAKTIPILAPPPHPAPQVLVARPMDGAPSNAKDATEYLDNPLYFRLCGDSYTYARTSTSISIVLFPFYPIVLVMLTLLALLIVLTLIDVLWMWKK
jgi:hypothetical protein